MQFSKKNFHSLHNKFTKKIRHQTMAAWTRVARYRFIWKPVLVILATSVIIFFVLNIGFFYTYARYSAHQIQRTTAPTISEVLLPADTLVIPSLQIQAPVQYISEKSEKVYQAALLSGVVHFPGTALPGEAGNVYIFGHSSDYFFSKGHYKTIFAVLPSIAVGDTVLLTNSQGKEFVYITIQKKIVASTDTSVLSQDTQGKRLLTLQTSYPVGTALARYVVVAELKASEFNY